ncbi:MAG: hypothetical protein KBT39_11095 [Bacteroidales bacterium]|nr:hypothetical protein [Bacteroidales bacterium]
MKLKIYILLITVITCVNSAWAGQETQNGKQYNVVYLKSEASGNGDSKDTPVGTWENAYKKLTNTGNRDYDWEHNIIVIVGDMQINYREDATKDKSNIQGTAATITGVWPWDANDKATTDQITNGGQAMISGTTNNIGADVRFRNLRIQGDKDLQDRMSLRLHSTLFDEGLVMMGFADLGDSYGMIVGRKAPAFHIQISFDHDGNSRAADVKYEMPNDEKMTVTFKSGKYGRVAVSRAQGTSETAVKANYIQGTPEKPVMAHIIVDIQEGNDNTGNYEDDFGILLGGSSQGIVCADLQFDIKRGSIGTLVAGAQGNNIAAGNTSGKTIESWKIPQGTFAGRTIINLESNDVTIQNLYVGTQGRTQSVGANGTAYFYGQATLNMRGGTIEKGVFASAAAFSGVGNDTYHTPDYAIPYVDNNNVLTFSSYDNSKTMATVKSTFNGNVDLSQTVFTMNIFGGTIKGGLCGGSRGYDSYVWTKYAPEGAGSYYGNTNINIYGGTIEDGVYGGGLGASDYYENKDGKGTSGQEKFLTVAQVFGNTNVNIYGGKITGGIYGGGKGVAATSKNEYINIAKVIGSTNVTINPQTLKPRAEWTDPNTPEFTGPDTDWTYTGNIYGGGALGSVEGDTNVKILGGIINGDVFGAGQGEEGHPDKAKVTGTTNVTVGE